MIRRNYDGIRLTPIDGRGRQISAGAGAATERLADPKVQERLNRALARWESRTKPLVEAVRSSEHLTEKDFAIRINTKG